MKKSLKKVLAIMLIMLLVFSTAAMTVSAYSEEETLNFISYEINNGKVTITQCDPHAAGKVVIPETIGGYPVTAIADEAFLSCLDITQLVIPESVEYLGSYSSGGVEKIFISKNVKEIHPYAFYQATNLTEIEVDPENPYFSSEDGVLFNKDKTVLVKYPKNKLAGGTYTMPNSVEELAGLSFARSNIIAVNYSENLKTINSNAFSNSGLISAKIPDSVTFVGKNAYSGCSSLHIISFGTGITTIGDYFGYNENITSIAIPGHIKKLEPNAFANFTALEKVTVGKGLEDFTNAFNGCSKLKEVRFADTNKNFTVVDGVVFNSDMTELVFYPYALTDDKYTMPSSVISVRDYAFSGNKNLVEILLSENLETIGDYAFDNSRLKRTAIPDSVVSIGDYAFNSCNLTEFSMGNSVETIGDYAFYDAINDDGVTPLVIPESVTSIGYCAFSGEKFVFELIEVDPDNKYYSSEDNVLFNKDKTLLIQAPIYIKQDGAKELTYTVPDSVKTIGSYAFSASALRNIIFGKNVSTVSDHAFEFNRYIQSMTLNDGLVYIGEKAFYACAELTAVENCLPSSVKVIKPSAFSNTNITSVSIPEGVTEISENAFYWAELEEVYLPLSLKHIDQWAFWFNSSKLNVEIIDNVYYPGTFEQWNQIDINEDNPSLIFAYVNLNGEKAHKHTALETKITKEPTCTEIGQEIAVCNTCDLIVKTRNLEMLDHTKGELKVIVPSTCLHRGYEVYMCADCDEIYSSSTTYKTDHANGEWRVSLPATCTEKGIEEYYCFDCESVVDTRDIKSTGHTRGNWSVTTPATCTEKGVESLLCAICSEALDTREIGENGHNETEWTVTTPATCTDTGTEKLCCADCNEVLDEREIPANVHTNGEWVITTPPTHTNEGVITLYCAVCDELLETKAIDKLESKILSVEVFDITLNYKDTVTLYPSVSVEGVPEYTVSYWVADNSIVSVDGDGKLTALNRGSTDVTVTVTDAEGNTYSDTCKVEVKLTFWQWILYIICFGWLWM